MPKVEEIRGNVVMVEFQGLQGTNLWSLTALLSLLTVFDKRQRLSCDKSGVIACEPADSLSGCVCV